MEIKFVNNTKATIHEEYVNQVLDAKDDVVILVAFLKSSGLRSFIEKIHKGQRVKSSILHV